MKILTKYYLWFVRVDGALIFRYQMGGPRLFQYWNQGSRRGGKFKFWEQECFMTTYFVSPPKT